MSRYTITPESFIPPNTFSPYFKVSFRRPIESRNAIYPASGLQISFARPSRQQEIFLERLAPSDVQQGQAGLCTVLLGKGEVPRYAVRRDVDRAESDDEDENETWREEMREEVLVRLHAWKGEKHLGAWEVGRITGEDAFRVVG